MFENHELFERLLNAVLGEAGKKPVKVDKPKCQYTVTGESAGANSIRFDVFTRDNENHLYSMDIQGNYNVKRVHNRLAYYMCRAISNQTVVDSKYEDLKNVCVTFVMSNHKTNSKPVVCYQLRSEDDEKPYTDLITLYEVYAPQADELSYSSELKVFLKFFTIKTKEDAEAYCQEFDGVDFAKVLVQAYNSALVDKSAIHKVVSSLKYKDKSNDELIMELTVAKEEAEQKAEQKARREMIRILRKLDTSDEKIAEELGLTVEEVRGL